MSEGRTEALFDILFYGLDVEGEAREGAINKLASMMRMSAEEVQKILAEIDDAGRVVGRRLTEAQARKHYDALLAIGARCLMRPTQRPGSTLELVPMSLEAHLDCPRCQHQHVFKKGEEPPSQCESCGLVFAKYDRVEAEKEERERIKQALLARQSHLQEQRAKEQQRIEAEIRRKELEEELRRELGIPKAMASRTGLIATAGAVLALGIGLGVVGAYILALSGANKDEEIAAANGEPAAVALPIGTVNPGLAAHFVLQQMESAAPPPAAIPTTAVTPSAPATIASQQLDDLKGDPAWDREVLAAAEAKLNANDFAQTDQLLSTLQDRSNGLRALTNSVVTRAPTMPPAELKASLDTLAAVAQRGDGAAPPSMADIAHIASAQADLGLLTEAEGNLQTLQLMADAAASPVGKVMAQGEIATVLTQLDRPEEARNAFENANEQLKGIVDRRELLGSVLGLAQNYAEAGQQGAALLLVEDVRQAAAVVQPAAVRDELLLDVGRWHVRAGNTQAARDLLDAFETPEQRSFFSLRLVDLAIDELNLPAAAEVATAIEDPQYRARALTRLALAETKSIRFRALAPNTFAMARADVNQVTDDVARVLLLSDLGRLLQHTGDTATASSYFSEAQATMQTLGEIPDRAAVISVLAGNLGRAGRFDEANVLIAQLDEVHRASVEDDLGAVLATTSLLQTQPPITPTAGAPLPGTSAIATPNAANETATATTL